MCDFNGKYEKIIVVREYTIGSLNQWWRVQTQYYILV